MGRRTGLEYGNFLRHPEYLGALAFVDRFYLLQMMQSNSAAVISKGNNPLHMPDAVIADLAADRVPPIQGLRSDSWVLECGQWRIPELTINAVVWMVDRAPHIGLCSGRQHAEILAVQEGENQTAELALRRGRAFPRGRECCYVVWRSDTDIPGAVPEFDRAAAPPDIVMFAHRSVGQFLPDPVDPSQINARQGAAYQAGAALGAAPEEGLRDQTETRSPSQPIRRIGGYLVDGLRLGIADEAGGAEQDMANLGSRMADALTIGRAALGDFFGSILDGSDAAKEALLGLIKQIAQVQFTNGVLGLPGMGAVASGIGSLLIPSFARGTPFSTAGLARLIDWPAEQFRMSMTSYHIDWTSRSAGRGLSGHEQVISSGTGTWRFRFGLIIEPDSDRLKRFEALVSEMRGRLNTAVIPLYDRFA